MSWIQRLYETYENCLLEVGKPTGNKVPLLPVGHTYQQAHIEISIDGEGNFKGAVTIAKGDTGTVIPCTEESGSRSGSDPKSHPLCDKLQYIAKDLSMFVTDETGAFAAKQRKWHENYRALLKQWCESEYTHAKARAVFSYISKGTVTSDLIESGVLSTESSGGLKIKYANVVIRWRVNIPNDLEPAVWRDRSLFDRWGSFDKTRRKGAGLCYVTGLKGGISSNHPKYIRAPGDSAKLISSNDDSGFTYRGRFTSVEQACGVSQEVTQKAHSALRWLIARQGKVFYEGKDKKPGLTIVAWATSGQDVPDPVADTFTMLGLESIQSDTDMITTAQEVSVRLRKKIAGYNVDLGDTTDVIVMGLDSATPGRMAITFYRELTSSDFLKRIDNWHNHSAWVQYRRSEITDKITQKTRRIAIRFVGAAAPGDIAEAAYGCSVDDKLRKATVTRIVPCIIDGQKVPRDLVESAVRRASHRLGSEDWEWERTLSVACALYRKFKSDYQGEEFDVALDTNRTSRDYLFGRLLALAESLEQWALNEAKEDRPTTAARLMQRFSDHPYTTWRSIELALGPYKARLGSKSIKRQRLITEVIAMFVPDDFTSDKRLSGEFLLGYHCQREALRPEEKIAGSVGESFTQTIPR